MPRHRAEPRAPFALAVLVALAGCTPSQPGSPVTLTPDHGPLSGYYDVTLWLDPDSGQDVGRVDAVRVGGVDAYDVFVLESTLVRFVVQGAPAAGPVDVELHDSDGWRTFAGAFTYDPPVDPLFDRVVSLGASFSQGVQAAVPSQHAALHSPSHVVATQAGAYLPLPMLTPDLFPAMQVTDIGPPPRCQVPPVVTYLAWSATEALQRMQDPETGLVEYTAARVDPDLEVHNLGVGGFRVSEVLRAPESDDFYRQFLAHIVYDPFAEIYDTVPHSPLELAEQLEPTVVFSVDLFGNDLVLGFLEGNGIDLAHITPVDEFEADLTEVLQRLSATGAQVFVANAPHPSALPAAAERKAWMIELGYGTAEQIDADIAAIDALAETFNGILDEQAARWDNVHVVDLSGVVDAASTDGIVIGDVAVTTERFGGLVSLDGLHFADVGYAVLADAVIATVNEALGTEVPRVDLAAVLEGDPYSPAALTGAGLPVDECAL